MKACRALPAFARALAILLASSALPAAAVAQGGGGAADDSEEVIIVPGIRGSAITNIAPLTTLDRQAIEATGATNMSELLKAVGPVTKSASGADPIFLINGQRVSSYQEIGTLPPEAIDKMEVLPEPAAVGSTTRLGSVSGSGNLGITRLEGDSRLSVTLDRKRTGAIEQSERHVLPDPEVLFDELGNVTGLNGGEIDPALSALSGETVMVAPVPLDGRSLSAFAVGANQVRTFSLDPYRTLSPQNDSTKAEATWGNRVGKIGATLSLGAERSRDRSLGGPATARLVVPGPSPFSPFAGKVVLNRYLTEVDPLHQRQAITKLRAAGTLRGAIAGWRWDLTASADQQMVRSFSELRVDLGDVNATIAAGADPFGPFDPALLTDRLTNRGHVRTRTRTAKTVWTNAPFELPAGPANVTGTAEAERADVQTRIKGADPYALDIGRSRFEGGVAIDLPISSKEQKVLPWLGDLSVNGSQTLRRVTNVGSLQDRIAGISWAPAKGVQILVQHKLNMTAPPLEQLASPVVHLINVPMFDYAIGQTRLINVSYGGNPDLDAERRRVRSVAVNYKPFEKRDLRVSATFEDVAIRDQTGVVVALSRKAETILPDLLVRNSAGELVSVSYRPINFYLERQKLLNIVVSSSGEIGKAPPQDAKGAKRQRFSYYGGIGPTIRFSDRLRLRRGTAELDLLDGDSVAGWGPGRFSAYFYGAINHPVGGFSVDGWYGGKNRVRNDNPAADLRTSPVFKMNASAHLSLLYLMKDQEWARKLQLKIDVQNLTDARPRVRDGFGRIPLRLQPDVSEPVGRTITLSLRKRFQAGAGDSKAR